VRSLRVATFVGFAVTSACGSRTEFDYEQGPPPPPECVLDKDCDGFGDRCFPVGCVAGKCQDLTPVSCDDGDPCTADTCDPDTGKCSYGPATFDLDGDDHRAPLFGQQAGAPGSCGDDCDDTNAAARPGGIEVCDGVDNDCNGVVDDGASLASIGQVVQVSDAARAFPASIAFAGGDSYMSAYSGEVASRSSVYLAALSQTGMRVGPPTQFTVVPADAYGGPLAWTGDRFGIAWSDRRDARGGINYEVYFNIANPDGTKRNPDLRITHAEDFSIDVSLAWTGNEFVVVWQDSGLSSSGRNEIYGQRINVDGAPIGGNVRLIDDGSRGQNTPAIAAGQRSLGIVWMRGDPTSHEVMFAPFDRELKPLAPAARLSASMTGGVTPIVVYNKSQYLVAWHDPDSRVKTVYGAVRGELGEEIVAAKPLTRTPAHARYPALLPYGDRALLVWSDDRDQNSGYELYAKTLDRKLETLGAEMRITSTAGDSTDSTLSFGPQGEVGVLFADNRTGSRQVYFTHLRCVTPPTVP